MLKRIIYKIKYAFEARQLTRALALSMLHLKGDDTINAEKMVEILSWINGICSLYPEYNQKVVNVDLGSLKPPSDNNPFDNTPPLIVQKTGNGIIRILLSHEFERVLYKYFKIRVNKTSIGWSYYPRWYDTIVKLTLLFLSYYDDTIDNEKIWQTKYIFILGDREGKDPLYFDLSPPSKNDFVRRDDGSSLDTMMDEDFISDLKLSILDIDNKEYITDFQSQKKIVRAFEDEKKKIYEINKKAFRKAIEKLEEGVSPVTDARVIKEGLKGLDYMTPDEMRPYYSRALSIPREKMPNSILTEFDECINTLKYFCNSKDK